MAELKIISMDEVQSKEVNWLWYPYIPYGKITIIQGDPGEGKTTLALRLAALLSKGEALPYDDTEREPVKIIYQTAEDGLEDTIKPRLEAAEADCTQIKVIDESEVALSMLDERIEKAIIEVGARVVILDPIQAYVGANINMNNANEVRNVMAQIGRIAEKYDCAVLIVGHMNKGSGNKSSYRGLGSIDFQASARSVLIVGRIKDNPQVRVMVQDKSSLAPEGEAIAFELDIYGFNRMLRFNSKGDFNLPVGNVDFNKNVVNALNSYFDYVSDKNIELFNMDFQDFIEKVQPTPNDMVYLDPPYLITFSEYNKLWNEDSEMRLIDYLDELNSRKIRFAVSNVLWHRKRYNGTFNEWAQKYNIVRIKSNYISFNDNTEKDT